MKKIIFTGAVTIILSMAMLVGGLVISGNKDQKLDNTAKSTKAAQSSATPEAAATKAPTVPVDVDPDSITVLVNREYRLDENFVPRDLVVPDVKFSYYGIYERNYMRQVAATHLEKMFRAASDQGLEILAVSGYRSYARQVEIHQAKIASDGEKAADKVSAQPGSSEHQTGLTMDVSCNANGCELTKAFAQTAEGQWLAANSYKYGFIIRYPENKQEITGYTYEPWHVRYVGKRLAKYLYRHQLTLEEYYEITPADSQIAQDIIDDEELPKTTDEPEMTTAPTRDPDITVKPVRTPEPETPAPKPSRSPAPKKTEKPSRTKAPKKTAKPSQTTAPKKTAKPSRTTTPEETQTPAQTTQPQEPAPQETTEVSSEEAQ